MSKKHLFAYQWARVKPYPKWWQVWKPAHELKEIGRIKVYDHDQYKEGQIAKFEKKAAEYQAKANSLKGREVIVCGYHHADHTLTDCPTPEYYCRLGVREYNIRSIDPITKRITYRT